MCGIFGYFGSRRDAGALVLQGLKHLDYRGYDSWGVAVSAAGQLLVDKRVGQIGSAASALPASHAGLGHTRWATHGAVTEHNAHPHLDCHGRFALVHNGMISNHTALREPLRLAGHGLVSETDTEVAVHMLEEEFARLCATPQRLVLATAAVSRRLEGLNAIIVLDGHTGQLAAATCGSPLVIGWAEDGTFLASDYAALLAHTRRVSFVPDGVALLIGAEGCRLFGLEDGQEQMPELSELTLVSDDGGPSSYPDAMSKEIHEQPRLLRRASMPLADCARRLSALIAAADEVVFVGCGSSAHAALTAQYLLAGMAGRRTSCSIGSEFRYLQAALGPRSLVVVLSQSGETIDVLEAALVARACGAHVAAVVNVEGSSLSRIAHSVLPLGAGIERCVLSTKSFTAKLALLLLTACELSQRASDGCELIERAAAEIELLLHDERRETVREIAASICDRQHLFVIGRGPNYPLALESALKIKEVSYIHAEGFAGGELKHGVMALIEPGTPCLVIAPDDQTLTDTLASAMQLKARGAMLIGLSPSFCRDRFDHHVAIADLGAAHALVGSVPAQLLGYDLAKARGCDPDKPRNLAKSVTVK
jgi:glutamine---fructose-6-phosphate transaminase (isomerizing)